MKTRCANCHYKKSCGWKGMALFYFWLLIGFAFLVMMILSAKSAKAEPWEFNIKNDYVIPGGLDRFLTNAFRIKSGKYSFANEMYTPTDKKNPLPPNGDRPWDGYSYFEYEDKDRVAFGEEFISRYRIGAIGKASGTEALQKFIHDDLGAGAHPTWAAQNLSELAAEVVLSKRTREYVKTLIGDTQIANEYGARLGNVNVSSFLDQEIRRHLGRYFYFYSGLRGETVLYNTHLDGRLFHDDYYTVDRIWFVASARSGIEMYFPRLNHWFVSYGYEYKTEEFEGQNGRHSFGSLTFGRRF